MESLYVWKLDSSRIRAHSSVVQFYERLRSEPIDHTDDPPVLIPAIEIASIETTDANWNAIVGEWKASPSGKACLAFVEERRRVSTVYPPADVVLTALDLTPIDTVRVVLLGQDPYHGPGQAHGLSFSVQHGIPLPPSLKNIRKECMSDLGLTDGEWPSTHGELSHWARCGVLLLNTILTVDEGNPASHEASGWNTLTQKLLEAVVNTKRPIVFLAWGKHAQTTIQKLTLHENQTVMNAVHPSPLSAHRGFFGSKPFSQTNTFLMSHGVEPIRWAI
jgi:uracil-DNA glycosylase